MRINIYISQFVTLEKCQLYGCFKKIYILKIIICVLKLFLSFWCNNSLFLFTWYFINTKNMCLRSHTGMWKCCAGQSCLTADIWFYSECGNTIPDRSKGQPNQLRNARVGQGGSHGGSEPLYGGSEPLYGGSEPLYGGSRETGWLRFILKI